MMGPDIQGIRDFENVPERVRRALPVLLEAVDYADQTSGDRWEFAVEMERLASLQLDLNDFRWLVRKDLVEHRCEVTRESDDGRAFRPTGDLTFPDGTCFVLTEQGIALARAKRGGCEGSESGLSITNGSGHRNGSKPKTNGKSSANGAKLNIESCLPKWDTERRTLTVNGVIVKHFKWTAPNQEAILSAFEEDGWPPHIDDPLPPHAEQDSKRRLSDTIKCLNRKQAHSLIHFHGDGTGEGVVWEFVARRDSSAE